MFLTSDKVICKQYCLTFRHPIQARELTRHDEWAALLQPLEDTDFTVSGRTGEEFPKLCFSEWPVAHIIFKLQPSQSFAHLRVNKHWLLHSGTDCWEMPFKSAQHNASYLTSSKENYIQCPEHIQRESYAEICVYIRLICLGANTVSHILDL